MKDLYRAFAVAAVLSAIALAACGGSGSSNNSQSGAGTAPTSAAQSEISKEEGALPAGTAETVPPKLRCPDAIVWVNMSRKTYHMAGDPYYGRTKHGEYMCESAAEAKGYRLAGTPHRHTTGMQAEPSPT
jgi:predicted small lipoprotein YifL